MKDFVTLVHFCDTLITFILHEKRGLLILTHCVFLFWEEREGWLKEDRRQNKSHDVLSWFRTRDPLHCNHHGYLRDPWLGCERSRVWWLQVFLPLSSVIQPCLPSHIRTHNALAIRVKQTYRNQAMLCHTINHLGVETGCKKLNFYVRMVQFLLTLYRGLLKTNQHHTNITTITDLAIKAGCIEFKKHLC